MYTWKFIYYPKTLFLMLFHTCSFFYLLVISAFDHYKFSVKYMTWEIFMTAYQHRLTSASQEISALHYKDSGPPDYMTSCCWVSGSVVKEQSAASSEIKKIPINP
jgi:hypothetical protein